MSIWRVWKQRSRFPDFFLYIFVPPLGIFRNSLLSSIPSIERSNQFDPRREDKLALPLSGSRKALPAAFLPAGRGAGATRHITQNLSAAPGGSKDGQSLARAVEREEEAERRAYAQLAVLDALFAEIDAALVQLDANEYCALRKYYLDGLKWEQVAADMNFTSRGIFACAAGPLNT